MGHASHGHEPHGHDAHAAPAGGHAGPAELPPVPEVRHLTPAPEDFATSPGLRALAWPFLWAGIALLVHAAVVCRGWVEPHASHAPASHGAPAAH